MTIRDLFDRVLKVLARDYPRAFLEVAFPEVPFRLIDRLQNVELGLPTRRVDFVHRLLDPDGSEYLFHIEFQTRHDAAVPRNLFIYSALLTAQFDLPVISTVFYVMPRRKVLPESYEVKWQDVVFNRFRYRVVKLWEYEAEIKEGRWPELAPLLLVLAEEPTEELLRRERDLILRERDAKRRADLLACAIIIGSRYFERDFLWQFFREEVKAMREATIIEEWIKEGEERGRQQGIQQGLRMGALQTRREDIMRLLLTRFDMPYRVGKELEDALGKIEDIDVLGELMVAAVQAETLQTFREQLEKALKQ
ncbi:MAG: hypothetical protein DRI61_17390 [Chloroflexi bacterium]|nr:MAG: hypothetical protein DRI61_17390 [Chloroflexota bacterium]